MSVKVEDLAGAVRDILDDYAVEISAGVERAVEETSRSALAKVREKSPKRTGRYRKGWRRVLEKAGIQQRTTKATIYNATDGSRVHLIENGHQKAGGGRVEGIPHVRPAEELAAEMLPRLVEQELRR